MQLYNDVEQVHYNVCKWRQRLRSHRRYMQKKKKGETQNYSRCDFDISFCPSVQTLLRDQSAAYNLAVQETAMAGHKRSRTGEKESSSATVYVILCPK